MRALGVILIAVGGAFSALIPLVWATTDRPFSFPWELLNYTLAAVALGVLVLAIRPPVTGPRVLEGTPPDPVTPWMQRKSGGN